VRKRLPSTIPCPFCKRPRANYRKVDTSKPCKQCRKKANGGKGYAVASRWASEQAKDKVRRAPTTSWWLAPREHWGETVEQQRRERFQAAGVGGQAAKENV
jgi:hypothetical protein